MTAPNASAQNAPPADPAIPNWLQIAFNVLIGSARELVHQGKEALRRAKHLLILAFVFPMMLLTLGVGIGFIGEKANSMGTIGAGQSIIIVAAFLAAFLLLFVLIRATTLAFIITAGSNAASEYYEIFPEFPPDTVKNLARKLAGIAAWMTGICVYAQIVPVWRAPVMSLIAATAMLGLAYVMAAGWFNGRWARISLLLFLLLSLAVITGRIVSPRFSRTLDEHSSRFLGPQHLNGTDRSLIERLSSERDELRRRAAERGCRGYCSDQLQRVQEIERDIRALEDGTYWTTVAPSAHAPVSTAVPAVPPAVSGGTADLPPPPVVPRRSPAASADPGASHDAPPAARPRRSDDPYRGLDRYPELAPDRGSGHIRHEY